MFGVDCASGTTFTDGTTKLSMTSMFVPDAVMSLAVRPKSRSDDTNFSKSLNRFQKEDPTFRVHFDAESKETILSGMGELHLEIYLERMRREYATCVSGRLYMLLYVIPSSFFQVQGGHHLRCASGELPGGHHTQGPIRLFAQKTVGWLGAVRASPS
jgi:hypothetical protein